jgi:hypothetical protein
MNYDQKYDMSCFNGTEYEGMTFLQVRRQLTPAQVKRFTALNKRTNRVASFVAKNISHARTYS